MSASTPPRSEYERAPSTVTQSCRNDTTERELKPAQRHRKNSLFFKNKLGAAVGDVLLSVIRTCTSNGHDPVRYLSALARHKAQVRAGPQHWLPWNYEQQLSTLN